MKSVIIACAMILNGLLSLAQGECKDIIYPIDNESIIFNCCIYEVKDSNVVYYVREGDSAYISAASIVKDGMEIKLEKSDYQVVDDQQNPTSPASSTGLYKGKDYDYYYLTYKGATSQRNAGAAMTFLGLILEISGFAIGSNSTSNADNGLAIGMIVVGGVFETVGVPLWISGAVKRANNKRVMDEIEKGVNLSFGTSTTGIGLVLKF